jgi:hypothetical protein
MPVQFIAGSFKGVREDRRNDIYRMLHLAFDHGYLFDVAELEEIWLKKDPDWQPLPQKDHDIWLFIEKHIDPAIAGDLKV